MPLPCWAAMIWRESSSRLSRKISTTLRSWKSSMLGQWTVAAMRDIARHLLPQIAKLVALVPDVIAGGIDGVGLARRIIAGAARRKRTADIGLGIELADGALIVTEGRWKSAGGGTCLWVADCGSAQSGTSTPGGGGGGTSDCAREETG